MNDPSEKPSIKAVNEERGQLTTTFAEMQACEKFGTSPLEFYVGKKAEWIDHPEIKALKVAYCQLIAEHDNQIREGQK